MFISVVGHHYRDIRPALSSYSLSTNAHCVKLYIVHFNLLSTIAHCVIFIFSVKSCTLRHFHFVCQQLCTVSFSFSLTTIACCVISILSVDNWTLYYFHFACQHCTLCHFNFHCQGFCTLRHFYFLCQQLHTFPFLFSANNCIQRLFHFLSIITRCHCSFDCEVVPQIHTPSRPWQRKHNMKVSRTASK